MFLMQINNIIWYCLRLRQTCPPHATVTEKKEKKSFTIYLFCLLFLFLSEEIWLSDLKVQPSKLYIRVTVRCQQDLLFLSQTCRVFESDLPCFGSDLPPLESDFPSPSVSPSHFSNQSFPLSKSELPIFLSQSFPKSVFLIFRVRLSHFFWSFLPTFASQLFSFLDLDLPIFMGQSFPLF